MCLRIDKTLHPQLCYGAVPLPFVASDDILVTKMLKHTKKKWLFGKDKFETPFMVEQVKFDRNGMAVLADQFSFSKAYSFESSPSFVDRGIHAFTGVGRDSTNNIQGSIECGNVMYSAIIPKGTEFYIGNYGDIVAEKIIIFSSVKAYLNYVDKNGRPERFEPKNHELLDAEKYREQELSNA